MATEDVAGETVTEATGTGTTVTFDQPSTPSILAKMTVLPTLIPVTNPDPVTSAMLGVLLDHDTVRPASGWPFALKACAVSPMDTP